MSCSLFEPSNAMHYWKFVLQRALLEVHRRLLEGDHSMSVGSTAPVVTRFLVNQSQANNLLQRSADCALA